MRRESKPRLPAELRLGELPLLVRLLEAGDEEGLIDPSLEDRYAHLHTPRDDLSAMHASLAAELGGRQVDRHVLLPPRRFAERVPEGIGCAGRRKQLSANCGLRSGSEPPRSGARRRTSRPAARRAGARRT